MSSPDGCSFGAVDADAVPAVTAFEVADAAFAADSPFEHAAEGFSMFFGAPCWESAPPSPNLTYCWPANKQPP
ncbi:MAG: hypothetical protein QOD93_1941 [Acetobacteraceae bacterium]|nr:hypothetical protein [Acetobacteraceae bacterium]